MRNLSQHPITREEILDCLTELADDLLLNAPANVRFGDMRPAILREAGRIIASADPATNR